MVSPVAEGKDAGKPRALQLCPNDRFAFYDICRNHARVLTHLGFDVITVFFSLPAQLPQDQLVGAFPGRVEHLGIAPLKGQTRAIAAQIREGLQGGLPDLIVAHRYRAFRVAMEMCQRTEPRISGVVLALAHEYGFLRGWRRRRRVKHFGVAASNSSSVTTWLAGVSEPVSSELTEITGHPSLNFPNVIDVDAVDRDRLSRIDARLALGLNPNVPLIGFVGRLEVIKNPLDVLLGFNAARSSLPQGTQLVYLGDGTLRDALQQKACALGIEREVQFLGFVSDARRYLAGIDTLVVPASPREAFGMVLLEAMLARVPIVCADSPGPNTILQNLGERFKLGRLDTFVTAVASTLAVTPESEALEVSDPIESDLIPLSMSSKLECARRRVLRCYSLPVLADRYRSLLSQSPTLLQTPL